MTTKPASEANGCTFQWKIQNISHSWKKKGERIESPAFIADALAGTKWLLWLYPAGKYDKNDVGVILVRAPDCSGPTNIIVNYQLSLLDKNGKLLTGKTSLSVNFGKDFISCSGSFARQTLFIIEREEFLPEDTLTVQCALWEKEETFVKAEHVFARTVFKVNRRSFVWKIDEFSSRKPGLRNKFRDDLIDFDIVLKEGLDHEKKLVVNGISFDESIKYFSFKTSIIDSEGEKECGSHAYFADDLKGGVSSTLLFTKKLMENQGRYLPQDVLSLDCDYVYSTGTVVDEFCCHGVISSKVTKVDVDGRNEHSVKPRDIPLTPALANDLKSMYSDGILSDTKLCTSTQTFPAHKTILCARSPVFRRMFSIDMKEKSTGLINIDDFEDETVHRMLLYIYTDSLEDLQLDSACKLYAAAEKYEILSLRSRCSSFLKDNQIPAKACDILILADLHQDNDLKRAVQDFILRHDKEVFGSEQWKQLMASHIQLAADVMYRKVFLG